MARTRVPLAEMLGQIGAEIEKAHRVALLRGGVMQFEECELEFGFEVEKEGNTGIAISVFNFGGKLKKSDTNTIKIKYKSIAGLPKVAMAVAPSGSIPQPVRESNQGA